MYSFSPLPRTAGAALRDGTHERARVRLSAVADLARWAQVEAERPACIERLLRLVMADPDQEVRASAALGLADAEAEHVVPELLGAWREERSPRVRQMLLVALGELASPADEGARAVLLQAVDDEAPALRFQALVAAGRLLSLHELEPLLERGLGDPEGRLRHIACRLIEERALSGELKGERGRGWEPRLESLLADPEPDVALVAALLLAPRGSQPARAAIIDLLNGRRRLGQLDDEQAAIELCADLGLDAALPGLRARAFGSLWSGRSPLAFQARVALARLGDERARSEILRGLSSWSRSTRAACVAAAGLARLEAARPRLIALRRAARGDEDRRSVTEALLALDG